MRFIRTYCAICERETTDDIFIMCGHLDCASKEKQSHYCKKRGYHNHFCIKCSQEEIKVVWS